MVVYAIVKMVQRLLQRFSGVKCFFAESSNDGNGDVGHLTFIWRKNRITIRQDEFNTIYPELIERIPIILSANKKKRIDLVVILSTERMVFSTINSKNGVRRSLGLYLRSIPINLIPFSRPELEVFYQQLPELREIINGGTTCKEKAEENLPDSPLSPTTPYDRGLMNDETPLPLALPPPPPPPPALPTPKNEEDQKEVVEEEEDRNFYHLKRPWNFYTPPDFMKLQSTGDQFDQLCCSTLNSPSYQYIYASPTVNNIPTKKMKYLMNPIHIKT